jgi:hypothetical protein
MRDKAANKRLKLTSCRARVAAGYAANVVLARRTDVPLTRTQLNRHVRRQETVAGYDEEAEGVR